jgi:hypothetical protein
MRAQDSGIERIKQTSFTTFRIIHEHPLNPETTLLFEGGLYPGFVLYGGSQGVRFFWYVLPGIEIEYRSYYNLAKRLEEGKYVENNTGAYFSGYTISYLSAGWDRPVVGIGGLWGFQKVTRQGLRTNTGIGVEYLFAEDISGFSPAFRLNLSWVPKKWRSQQK